MKKWIVFFVVLFMFSMVGVSQAVDVDLKWDPVPEASGYRVYQSNDMGATWVYATNPPATVTTTTLRIVNVPEDRMVFFRVSSVKGEAEAVRFWSGAWYDHRNKPVLAPGGNSIP